MPKEEKQRKSFKANSPAMKEWYDNHQKRQGVDETNKNSNIASGFLGPILAGFCYFMVGGAVNGEGSWGIVVVVSVAYLVWLITSLIMFLNYRYKGKHAHKQGSIYSLTLAIAIAIIFVGYNLIFST